MAKRDWVLMASLEKSYILITPVKNEERNLPVLIDSIVRQVQVPDLWVIIDDGSSDRSREIAREAAQNHPFIKLLSREYPGEYDLEEHYSDVCLDGFSFALKICKENDIAYDYIGLSDADMCYPENYFSSLMDFFARHPDTGIASGHIVIKNEHGTTYPESKNFYVVNDPHGTGRLWTRRCFENTGGYLRVKSPDVVSNVIARLRGWNVSCLDIPCYELRDTGGKHTLWAGYVNRGKRSYYLGDNPLGVMNSVIDVLFISRQKASFRKSTAFVYGYLKSCLANDKKLPIVEVRKYIGSYGRIFNIYILFIKNILKRVLGLTEVE
jgi:glycosyltransferase involved in cell wall biosynthesis